jgi:hypothetical protein
MDYISIFSKTPFADPWAFRIFQLPEWYKTNSWDKSGNFARNWEIRIFGKNQWPQEKIFERNFFC